MPRVKTSSYILTLELKTNDRDISILDKRMEIGRHLYNSILGKGLKKYKAMIERKEYRKVIKELNIINKKYHNCKNETRAKEINKKRIEKYKELADIYKEFGLDEYSFINDMTSMYKPFNKNIDNKTAQAIASRAWKAIEKLLNGDGEKVKFKKYGELNSLEGKWNKSGIKYKDKTIIWNKLNIPVIVKPNDDYAHKALEDRVKYCRIVRKFIRGKYKYYVQLVLEGTPPIKINKTTGEVKRLIGAGNVGLDIGTQTLAVSSDYLVELLELAPEVNNIEKVKRRLSRKLDRQRRANNPNNFKEDGTIKRGIKLKWVKSKRYIKTQNKLKEIQRKQSAIRKQSHEILANHLIGLGDRILVETMNYKGLQRRAKKTTVNKNGKINKKKRFGKSLANKAPAMLLEIIDRKLKYKGLELVKIDTKKVKASQYNHIKDDYIKKDLKERWNDFGKYKIQRDVYSSFIIKNVIGIKADKIDREQMILEFKKFKILHDNEIERLKRIKRSNYKLISSFGI